MANPLDRWKTENEEKHGTYAPFSSALLAGFEKDLRTDDILAELWDNMGVLTQLTLFGFVITLLEEAKE